VEISEKLQAAKVTAQEIDEARVRYQPVAARGAVLFFVLDGLSAVNSMYEYSLASFLTVFNLVRALLGKAEQENRAEVLLAQTCMCCWWQLCMTWLSRVNCAECAHLNTLQPLSSLVVAIASAATMCTCQALGADTLHAAQPFPPVVPDLPCSPRRWPPAERTPPWRAGCAPSAMP
jgi:hypothetical protein